MNISENLIRIKEGKENIIKSLKNKGVSIADNTLINEIPTIIDNAEIGGGGGSDVPSVPDELIQKYEGATVFRITVPTDNYEFAINLCNDATKATYDVDWGDGSLESGLKTNEQHHTYRKKGIYDVNVYNLSNEITLGGYYYVTTNEKLYYLFNNINNDYWKSSYQKGYDSDIVEKIIIGNKISTQYGLNLNDCTKLEYLEVITSKTSLGNNYFDSCKADKIVFSDSVTSLGTSTFQSCSNLRVFDYPKQINVVPDYTFNICSKLEEINFHENITSIGSQVFQSCYNLWLITCEAMTAPTIVSNSFPTSGFKYTKRYLYVPKESTGYDSGNWKTYLIDKGWELRYIEDRVKTPTTLKLKTTNNFFHNLQTIGQANLIDYELIDNEYIYHFDDKIYKLPINVFGSQFLEGIELPEGVDELGNGIFQSSKFSNITLPNSLKIIGNTCFNNNQISSILIPDGVISIGDSAFSSCKNLQSVTIPKGVTTIKNGTFSSCENLQSVTIPEGVTSIGINSFSSCYKLSIITCKAITAPTIQSNTFTNVGYSVPSGTKKVLRVPEGSDYSTWKSKLSGFTIEYIPLSELQ